LDIFNENALEFLDNNETFILDESWVLSDPSSSVVLDYENE
jgi:hypothetical protein